MQGNDKVIDHLNQILYNELRAINQYFLHSRMLADWGLNKFILNDTCCYPEPWFAYWTFPIPEQFNRDTSEKSISWKRIDDNEFSLIFPKYSETDFPINIGGRPSGLIKTEVPENVSFELLDCNRLKFNNYNILNLLMGAYPWFDSTYIDVKFVRSPKVNHKS